MSVNRKALIIAAVVALLGLGWVARRRAAGATAPQLDLSPGGVIATVSSSQGDVDSVDPVGSWADDGGSAPGEPGDDPAVLSMSPTLTTRHDAEQ